MPTVILKATISWLRYRGTKRDLLAFAKDSCLVLANLDTIYL
jgi:hypothetical protein